MVNTPLYGVVFLGITNSIRISPLQASLERRHEQIEQRNALHQAELELREVTVKLNSCGIL